MHAWSLYQFTLIFLVIIIRFVMALWVWKLNEKNEWCSGLHTWTKWIKFGRCSQKTFITIYSIHYGLWKWEVSVSSQWRGHMPACENCDEAVLNSMDWNQCYDLYRSNWTIYLWWYIHMAQGCDEHNCQLISIRMQFRRNLLLFVCWKLFRSFCPVH